ncbi:MULTISPECIES: putative monovalent cation/H+ antiporter subunit A [unclassified Thioalkalivibrio]|uniref:putative monovalent cation/H+ antiporter subunit A n=1 Tax=unclassified Thioalkalivibrio TaxID=2621013 RepID=UPI00036475AF|nr:MULTISPECIES: putative monovalent cation/H+ antiporter subunit A [unclassified Thioalkalivibrio]PYG04465.1 multisubunit sodium/proton antiporter MrpA subunit [Thioalkalivibrio sp. ALE21]
MLFAILSIFVVAALAPVVHRATGRHSGWVLALLPAALFVYFASFVPTVAAGETVRLAWQWMPGLDVQFSFLIDGLSLMFALLIAGIGVFVVSYAGRYLEGHRDLGRFYVLILSFMGSMLGLVLADNIILMFIFWELTSITSYLLIGFNHEQLKARKAALQGLIVTVGGGLALLAGLVLLGMAAGSWELSEILAGEDSLHEHALYLPLVILILLGTFTKSAQFPFHFWLPNAMAAPTPVSAYLHSATMVKAGVYLMARLNPELGGTELWTWTLGLFGAVTMFTGAWMAIQSTEIKKLLAYSTVMALGTLTMLIGIDSPYAAMAGATFLLAHSLYKGALFMLAGSIDHGTGEKEVPNMGGLRRAMPLTAAFSVIAALSLAGLPPLFGFVGKELMLEAALGAPDALGVVLPLLAVASAILVVAVAAIVGLRPFFGARPEYARTPHESPGAMLAGPAVLATLGLIFGIFPALAQPLVVATATSIHGADPEMQLKLWHGINLPLGLSLLSLAAGLVIYRFWDSVRAGIGRVMAPAFRVAPERGYDRFMDGLVWFSAFQTRVLQNGYLRTYVMVTMLTTVALVLATFATLGGLEITVSFADILVHEWVIAALVALAALFVATTNSRLAAVASLGIIGFGVSLIYVFFSAPDLGITQVLVETLTVILLVLVLFRLPGFLKFSNPLTRVRDVIASLVVGVTMTAVLMATLGVQYFPAISEYHIAESEPSAYGRNIVNVILVDFRALDTLGELFVLALAAVGVYAMIKFRAEDRKS